MPPTAPSGVDFLSDPPLDLTQRKARYGVVYLRALAGQAGCTLSEAEPGEDVQSIDAKLGFVSGDVFVQVKTTKNHAMAGSPDITYYPDAKWLAKWAKLGMPAYFVVVVVPGDSGMWLDHDPSGTKMVATAAYWTRIDVSAIRAVNKIQVPRAQRLSAATLPQWEADLLTAFGA
jgi:hypothetical protein